MPSDAVAMYGRSSFTVRVRLVWNACDKEVRSVTYRSNHSDARLGHPDEGATFRTGPLGAASPQSKERACSIGTVSSPISMSHVPMTWKWANEQDAWE